MLDEPTADLDPKNRKELIEILNELNEREKTIVIALHDVNAVPEVADRLYVLDKTIIAEGTARDIFSNPKLLAEARLDMPEITRLFNLLRFFGYKCDELPLSIDGAVQYLTKTIETERGHIHLHLHMHEHAHKKEEEEHEHHA